MSLKHSHSDDNRTTNLNTPHTWLTRKTKKPTLMCLLCRSLMTTPPGEWPDRKLASRSDKTGGSQSHKCEVVACWVSSLAESLTTPLHTDHRRDSWTLCRHLPCAYTAGALGCEPVTHDWIVNRQAQSAHGKGVFTPVGEGLKGTLVLKVWFIWWKVNTSVSPSPLEKWPFKHLCSNPKHFTMIWPFMHQWMAGAMQGHMRRREQTSSSGTTGFFFCVDISHSTRGWHCHLLYWTVNCMCTYARTRNSVVDMKADQQNGGEEAAFFGPALWFTISTKGSNSSIQNILSKNEKQDENEKQD